MAMEMLSALDERLTEVLGPAGLMLLLGGLGIVLMVAVLPFFLQKKVEPFDKLKALRTQAGIKKSDKTELRMTDVRGEKLKKFANFLEPQDEETMTASRLKMVRAGYKNKNAVRMFHFAQLVLGLGFLSLGVIYGMIVSSSQEVSTQFMLMSTIGPGGVGYYLPIYWVQRRLQMRREEIISGFPDALDLMLVCVEAGQSLDQSINRVAKESRAGYPALADEFDQVAQEVKAGKERVTVLKDMAERVGVPDVASFVTTLVQSASFGTSISDALRVYSVEMRDKRVLRAEEKANTLPTKLTLGTMLFTVPPLMIILIGPSVAGIAKTLEKMTG
jgi:tight adherence protein C